MGDNLRGTVHVHACMDSKYYFKLKSVDNIDLISPTADLPTFVIEK